MRALPLLGLLGVLGLLACALSYAEVLVAAKVAVRSSSQLISDSTPSLRIVGLGFDTLGPRFNLNLGASGQPPLTIKDFFIGKEKTGLTLLRRTNKRWADLTEATPPVAISLYSVYLVDDPLHQNILLEPVVVALVTNTSSVNSTDTAAYCTNTCMYARDGTCDDARGSNYCEMGSDCQDCGPVGVDNSTRYDDEQMDDDDDYWTFNDAAFLERVNKPTHQIKTKAKTYKPQASSPLLVVMEGALFAVGAFITAAALYLFSRWYKTPSFLPGFLDGSSAAQSLQRLPITPNESSA